MLLNQNLECLKQTYSSNQTNGSTSSSPPSNLDVNSSPTSTSPSSTSNGSDNLSGNGGAGANSGVSSYGSLANSILNGTLTPPPDSGIFSFFSQITSFLIICLFHYALSRLTKTFLGPLKQKIKNKRALFSFLNFLDLMLGSKGVFGSLN